MATVQAAIVNRALRLIGQIGSGASPTTDESTDALTACNGMLDAWRTEGLMCYALREESLTLASGQVSRTIGPSGNLDTVRPLDIEAAWIVDSSNVSHGVRMLTDAQYAAIPDKTTSGDWPTKANYKASMPTGTIVLWPVPNSTRTMKLLTKVPFSALALVDTLAVPPGYEEAIVYNLAVRIAPEYERGVSQEVATIARMTKGSLKRANIKPSRARSEVASLVGGRPAGNILSDEP